MRLGAGASSRNSGAVSPRFRGHAPNEVTRQGFELLKRFLVAEAIECDFEEDVPAIYLAHEPDELDGPADLADAELATQIGSAFYRVARTTSTNSLHPGKLVHGLALANERAGVVLHERSPVQDLQRGPQGWVASTSHGSVTARQVVLATNGYTPRLGYVRKHIAVLHHRVVVTRPLAADEWRVSGLERWPLRFESGSYYTHTVRSTPDKRCFYRHVLGHRRGERVTWTITDDDRACGERELARRYPWLAGVPIEYEWHGITARTRDTEPILAELDEDLFFAGGYNGSGIMPGHLLGYALAKRLTLGERTAELPWFPIEQRPMLPPEPMRNALLVGALLYQRSRDSRRG
jgi:glycine/D-amino acid oxidase-like deaminating enzyme